MTDVEILDQSTPEDPLEGYAATCHANYRQGGMAIGEAFDCFFNIGNALLGARRELPSNEAFGAWFNAQGFKFSKRWALTMRDAAENEEAVRAALRSQLRDGAGSQNIEKAVKEVTAPTRVPRAPKPSPAPVAPPAPAADAPEPAPVAAPEPPPVVDEAAPSAPAQDPPFDAMREALRADQDVHDDLVQIIIGIEDPYQAAETILAKYVLTPRTET